MTASATLAAVEGIARRQLGLFTNDQAAGVGLSPQQLSYHSRAGGRWRRVAPRVYEVLSPHPDWRRPLMAAQLWGGPEAVLSHRSAALLLDLDGIRPGGAPEVCIPGGRRHPDWIVRRQRVPPADVIVSARGLRHTGVIRTVVDLAGGAGDDLVEMMVESVLRRGLASENALRQAASAQRNLRRVMARRPPGAPATGSELETRFIQVTRPTAVPEWARQWPVAIQGRVVAYLDLALPDAGLFAELDGRWAHNSPAAVLRDRHRQNLVVKVLGWRPLRYTWDDVVDHPRVTAADVEDTYRRTLARAH